MEVAIIGSGIAGISASLFLSKKHNVTIYERNNYIGGHTNTKKVIIDNKEINVDTGFIVFNKLNYPNLLNLFDFYNIDYENSDMSLSVSNVDESIEWSGKSLKTIFSDTRNIFDIKFIKFLIDIINFNRLVKKDINILVKNHEPLGQWLARKNFGYYFKENYLVPMSAAIWSSPSNDILDYPISSLFSFFDNHKLLHNKKSRPQWLTVSKGGQSYIKKILETHDTNIILNSKIQEIRKGNNKIVIIDKNGKDKAFDHVIYAIHPERILEIKSNFDQKELKVLKLFKTSSNKAFLHNDASLMPKNKKNWSSWNVFSSKNEKKISITYWMNKLQNIDNQYPLFVSLNPIKIPKADSIYEKLNYDHPIYNKSSIFGQSKIDELQGFNNQWYCGAWLGNGFHEAGISSSIKISKNLNGIIPWR